MAFDWVSFLIVFGIGLGGGAVSGVLSTIIGRFRLKRKINRELKRMKLLRKGYKCTLCNRFNPEQTLFCVFCGVPSPSMRVCGKCGTDLPKDADYCYLCLGGAVLKDTIVREPGIKITAAETPEIEPLEIEKEETKSADTEEIESLEYETVETIETPDELSEYKVDEIEYNELEEISEKDSQEEEEL